MDTEERFWSHVAIGAPDDCWPWTKALRKGYGTFKDSRGILGLGPRKDVYAHRVAFYFANGHWPEPLIRHSCDNPVCCNPAHLLEGTPKQNMHDKYERGRAVHPPGTHSAMSNLTEDAVTQIRILYSTGTISQKKLGDMFGVSQAGVSRIIRKERYK